jgi:hypothetical protein
MKGANGRCPKGKGIGAGGEAIYILLRRSGSTNERLRSHQPVFHSFQKNTSPPHFSFRIPFICRAFREGGVWQRGHSTPHLTPPSFYSASFLFPEHTTSRNLMKARIREEKSDLLSEVLSEVFGKHLTL